MQISAEYLGKTCDRLFKITVEKEVTSTNDIVKALANNGAVEGTVLIAEGQTAGKGRLARSFFSPEGCGVYLSILLRPGISAEDVLKITTGAAVAVMRAICRFTDEEVAVKWVNDIYMRDRKVCGILTESAVDADTGRVKYAVLGIGVNVVAPTGGFPEDIKDIAGAVFEKDVPEDIRTLLIVEILNQIKLILNDLNARDILFEYQNRSWLNGKYVDVSSGDDNYSAKVIGVGDDFELIVDADGSVKSLSFGEVSVKTIKKDG